MKTVSNNKLKLYIPMIFKKISGSQFQLKYSTSLLPIKFFSNRFGLTNNITSTRTKNDELNNQVDAESNLHNI